MIRNMDRLTLPPENTPDGENIASLVILREAERSELHARHMNEMMVRMLRVLGYDVGFTRGTGQYLFDRTGQRYLDLLSGWGVFGIGRNHPRLRAALSSVLAGDFANLVQMDVSPLAGILAERLLHYVPFLDKVLFTNSGAEAVEAAIKLARKATRRPGLVYCTSAFHGLSYGALSLTDDEDFRAGFAPFLTGCVAVPFDNLAALEESLSTREVAAFLVEPIQGNGVNMPSTGYFAGVQELCHRYGTLFVADEIQTGLGRTGRFLASAHWGAEPDMVLLSKTLSGGHVPVAAVLTRKWIFDRVFDRMDRAVIQSSTFAANDLAMAAGIATLDVIESEHLIENAARIGARLRTTFESLMARSELITQVRGKGLMIGIEFGRPRSLKLQAAWSLLESLSAGLFCQLIALPLFRNHRILVQVAGHNSHTIKLLPALVLSDEDCSWIESAFDTVVTDCYRIPGAVWSFGKTLAKHAGRARTAG